MQRFGRKMAVVTLYHARPPWTRRRLRSQEEVLSALPVAHDAAAQALARAESAWSAHALMPCRAHAREAWDLLRSTVDLSAAARPELARTALLLGGTLYRLGRFDALMAEGDEFVAVLRQCGRDEDACQVLRWMALGGAEIAAFEDAIDAARSGLALATHRGSTSLQVLLTNALAACFERMGDPWHADRLLRDALALSQRIGGDVERFVTCNNLAAVGLTAFDLLREDDPAEARALLERARADAEQGLPLAERIGDPFYRVYILANTGDILMFLGEHEAGEAHLRRALALAELNQFETQVWRVRCSLGELALQRGDPAAARAELQPLLQTMGARAPAVTALRCQRTLYRALRQIGQTEQALVCLERYLALGRRRVVQQLKAQAHNLVTRAEIEQAHRDLRYHREQAASLAEQAARDSLTGLANRRGLEQRLRALSQASDTGALAVAVLDIDAFKQINDTQGHAAGDAVLVRAARLLLMHLRQRDIVARLGGDEFVLVLDSADEAQAQAVLERIRQSAHLADDAPAFRFSAGVALAAAPWDGQGTLGEWLRPADEALYASKKRGGDTVTVRERN